MKLISCGNNQLKTANTTALYSRTVIANDGLDESLCLFVGMIVFTLYCQPIAITNNSPPVIGLFSGDWAGLVVILPQTAALPSLVKSTKVYQRSMYQDPRHLHLPLKVHSFLCCYITYRVPQKCTTISLTVNSLCILIFISNLRKYCSTWKIRWRMLIL